ncbi:N-acetylglucosamine-6-phosphate deacetylase [Neomegalonema sp.]|uniref:N-acetylglucosamine-6-phosphate deacetylase n=1 Tax=Neomegalonema sp. TaxID=2039713 RepID=UPI00262A2377|nr:N-acetylglucosamine-6-phosphate deacetylase [Neomegalonema sp.]MDD2869198.1 N-acetylglucosamine-6-phosphate deacetylase [Neomegalonema sp.]
MSRLIAPELLWLDGSLQKGLALEVEGGALKRLRPLGPEERPDSTPHLVSPGFIDLQVNGGGGVMVNSEPTEAGIRAVAAAHRAVGTAAILPTLITDAPERLDQTVEAMLGLWGERGVLGLHVEGPHISPERRGTHDARFIRPLDERTLSALRRLRAAGIPVLLTLAPEQARPDQIREAREMGVVLSMGHTAATADQALAALEAGFSMGTHLYNAMTPMSSRDPGVVGTLIDSEAWCGLICDGIHVSWPMARIAIRGRPRGGRSFIVSDAMATVNGPDHFEIYGQKIFVRDGALVNAAGSLAGAHVDMAQSFANAVRHLGLPLEEALSMCLETPLEAMGLPARGLAEGTPLDEILVFDRDLKRVAV